MPRFKATPQQFNLNSKKESSNDEDNIDDIVDDLSSNDVDSHSSNNHDDSSDDHDDDSLQEDNDDEALEYDTNHSIMKRSPDTDENSPKQKQRKTCQNSNEPIPVTTECLNTLQTAAFLAQAAAVATVAALSSGQLIPIFPSETPPIAPLGLSLPTIPNENFTETTTATIKSTEESNTSMSNRNNVNLSPTAKKQSPNAAMWGPSSNNSDVDNDEGADEDDDATDKNLHQCKSREREKQFINCPVCCKTMRRGSLREHMDRHANSGKFKCDACEKTFSRASAREKHIRTHTGERPYKCELCSKAYRQKVHLNEHLRSHTGVRPYLCKLCGFCLASKSLLNRHLRTHGIKKNLDNDTDVWMKIDAPKEEVLNIAAEVGRVLSQRQNESLDNDNHTTNIDNNSSNMQSFKIEQTLSNSFNSDCILQLTPRGSVTFGRKYLCNLCPAGFPTVQALRSHRMTTHNVVTPHKCPQCSESFSSLKLMEGHLRKLHPQVCPICSKQMPERRKWMVEAHIREAHPEAVADHVGSSSQSKNHKKIKSKENAISATTTTTTTTTTSNNDTALEKHTNNCVSLELRKWKDFRPDKVHSSTDDDDDDDDDDDEDDENDIEGDDEEDEERESHFDQESFKDSNNDCNLNVLNENTSVYSIDHEQLEEENSLFLQMNDNNEKTDFIVGTNDINQLELGSRNGTER
ncbi:uncharacterized protein DC041_0009066 [Schistosoma bovis]|uniref:C2H2-type domain-containing protein n=1 Tax=Schistosoma bovis TaxID=6184 RepID=A0A430QBN2_SCHBO|nr:uncharacterized protein DC041_0009066 [Schistosoma bovis]